MKTISLFTLALVLVKVSSAAADPAVFQVKVTGHGRPMILIPGLACPGAVWDTTVAHFSADYECHVLSLAGFGGTPARTTAGPMLENAREELADYIREHRLDHPVVVGHSLGGFLALDLAANHPELVGRLVIVDSLPFLMGAMQPGATVADAKQAAAGMAQGFLHMSAEAYGRMIRSGPNGSTMAASPADLDRIIAWGLASDRATVGKAMTELYSADLRPALPRITAPALIFGAWTGYAPYSSHAMATQLYRDQYSGLKNFRLEISDTARHFIMFDDPQWLFVRMDNFLATPDSRAVSSNP